MQKLAVGQNHPLDIPVCIKGLGVHIILQTIKDDMIRISYDVIIKSGNPHLNARKIQNRERPNKGNATHQVYSADNIFTVRIEFTYLTLNESFENIPTSAIGYIF
jgi:hypothetical protein